MVVFRPFLVLISLLALSTNAVAQTSLPQVIDPARARLVTSDLEHFSQLLEALPSAQDTVDAVQRIYLDRASPGLRTYADNFGIDAERLTRAIRERPRFYASLADLEARVTAREPALRRLLSDWKEIYPGVVYPPVYFFVGTQRAGGLTRQTGLLISADMYSRDTETPLDEIGRPASIRSIDELPHLVAHELAHYQQVLVQGLDHYRALYRSETTLLGLAIREGSADFLAQLASDGHINGPAHVYGDAHECALWRAFRLVMHEADTGDWMFTSPSNGEWPQDLGYYVGYRITEAFYRQSSDPHQAVRDILAVTDFEQFLDRSGYAGCRRVLPLKS